MTKCTCAITDKSPTTAMNKATSSDENPTISFRYTKKHEYCPASGR